MENLEEATKKAKTIYPTADKATKTAFEKVFGKDAFKPKITDRIKTVEDAYLEIGIKRADYLPVKGKSMSPERYEQMCALTDFEIVVIALNEGVELTYADQNQKKWKFWLKHNGISGFAFDGTTYVGDDSLSFVGSRLDFATQELAEYAAKQFIDLINKIANH